MWRQSKKSKAAWIHRIRDKRIKATGHTTIFIRHRLTTLEDSTFLKKNNHPYKNDTLFNSRLLYLLHDIDTWNLVLVHRDKPKRVFARHIDHNPVLCASTPNKIEYAPFKYLMYYYIIR